MTDFKAFIKANKLKQTQVAEYLGVTPQYINQVVHGQSNLSEDKLEKLVQADWDISMLDIPPHIKVPATLNIYEPAPDMPTDGSLDISAVPVEVVEEIKEEIKKEEAIPIISAEVANTPHTNIRKYINDNGDELERIYLGDLLPAGVKVAERVRKISMLPTFQPGDWVFVKFINKDNITDGETYYFDFNTRPTMIRKVKIEGDRLRLIAKNPQFGDIIAKREEINNIGEVVGLFRGFFGDQYDDIEAVRRKKDEQIDSLLGQNGELIDQNGEALKIIRDLIKK